MPTIKKLYSAFYDNDFVAHANMLVRLIRGGYENILADIRQDVMADDWEEFARKSLELHWQRKAGWIYVARNPVTPAFIKVGMTRLPVEQRMTALNNEAVLGSYEAISAWAVHDRRYLEQAAHKKLNQFSRHKEHFAVSWQEACPLIASTILLDAALFKENGFFMPDIVTHGPDCTLPI